MTARSCGCHSHNGMLLSPKDSHSVQLEIPAVDAMESSLYLPSRVSVSGLELERDLYAIQSELQLLEQSERFHNGS